MVPELKFEISFDETNIILTALGKQPFENVASIIQKIQMQAQPQLPAIQEAMKASAEKPAGV